MQGVYPRSHRVYEKKLCSILDAAVTLDFVITRTVTKANGWCLSTRRKVCTRCSVLSLSEHFAKSCYDNIYARLSTVTVLFIGRCVLSYSL